MVVCLNMQAKKETYWGVNDMISIEFIHDI